MAVLGAPEPVGWAEKRSPGGSVLAAEQRRQIRHTNCTKFGCMDRVDDWTIQRNEECIRSGLSERCSQSARTRLIRVRGRVSFAFQTIPQPVVDSVTAPRKVRRVRRMCGQPGGAARAFSPAVVAVATRDASVASGHCVSRRRRLAVERQPLGTSSLLS